MSTTIGRVSVARDTGARRRSGRPSGPRPRLRERLPLPPLIALGGFAMVGLVAMLPGMPDDMAKPIAQRSLHVVTSSDQSVVISDVRDGTVVGSFPGAKDSFVRGVFHSLDAYRRAHGVGVETPYKLAEMSDGRVLLSDPATSAQIDLEGFGSANASKFTALLGLPPLPGPR